jgi:hypothetical protein
VGALHGADHSGHDGEMGAEPAAVGEHRRMMPELEGLPTALGSGPWTRTSLPR